MVYHSRFVPVGPAARLVLSAQSLIGKKGRGQPFSFMVIPPVERVVSEFGAEGRPSFLWGKG